MPENSENVGSTQALPALVFVYHSDSGFFNAVTGWAHKLLAPSTYNCALCRQIYGLGGMLRPWRTYLENQPLPVQYLYRDQIAEEIPEIQGFETPLILLKPHKGPVSILLEADQIRSIDSLSTLIAALDENLRTELRLLRLTVQVSEQSNPECPTSRSRRSTF